VTATMAGTSARRLAVRDGWILAALAVAVRVGCMSVWPARAFSCDLKDWRIIAGAMVVGLNPFEQHYASLLNWPPMWMECLYGLGKISDRLDWSFFGCVRGLLIGCDAVLVLSTWALLRLLKSDGPAFGAVLWGLVLNPFMILLTIQQGNFDVIPTIGIVWFLYFLIRWVRGGDPMDWLCAAGILGLAAFAKTFPLALAPLLAVNWRKNSWRTSVLGAAMCAGPAVLSLAPLYVLYPREILGHVVVYRGTPGPMGISGILQWWGGGAIDRYSPYFTAGLAIALGILAVAVGRRPLRREADWVLAAAIVLIGVFEFGSGYCPQYWMWVAPLLVIAYVEYRGPWRTVLVATAAVAVVTSVMWFAYNTYAGDFMAWWLSTPPSRMLSDWFNDNARGLVLICLPMTVMTLVLWIYGCRRVWGSPV
jgi:Glycosyltransferase family 87